MKIILASKSGVRKQILDKYKIDNEVIVSNIDEEEVKKSLLAEGANPLSISKNLAEIKSIKVSNKNPNRLVLGADSVVSLNDKLINKPKSRNEAFSILKKLNNSIHYLISSVCISKNGSMIWNHSDSSELKMKNLNDLPRKLARTNKGKLIPKTPAEIVNTLYGIGVSPAKNTAKNPQEL